MNNPERTRRRLAEAEARLAAAPDNRELADQVRRLSNALGCLEWHDEMNRLAARAWLALGCWARRN
jgi:hypothetical protein